MKTRKIIEIKCINDLEAISQAQELLCKAIKEQPFFKHTVTLTLSNGTVLQLSSSPINYNTYIA